MHADKETASRILSDAQKKKFVHDGFVKIENAFPQEVAAEARTILWKATECDPEDRTTWTRPVVRLGNFDQEPFRQTANTKTLHAAFDALVGVGRWVPRTSLGSFPVRFPHADDPGDTGWHVDASFPPNHATDSYMDWRVNLCSKGRVLLMLFLFSDVGKEDAPTRIRVGSHLRIARLLAPAGEDGMSILELSRLAAPETEGMEEVTATGKAGTVYLCHPFLLHAAQRHRGATPRFLAQPPLCPSVPLQLTRKNGDYSPVEEAIRLGLGE